MGGEITSSLSRVHISEKDLLGEMSSHGVDLRKVFAELDYNKSSELSFYELMVADWKTRHHVKQKEDKPKPKKHKEVLAWVGKVSNRRGAILLNNEDDSDIVFDDSIEWQRKLGKFAADTGQLELDLKMCFIGEKGAKMLADAIRKAGKMRQVKVMQLYGNYMTSPGISALADA